MHLSKLLTQTFDLIRLENTGGWQGSQEQVLIASNIPCRLEDLTVLISKEGQTIANFDSYIITQFKDIQLDDVIKHNDRDYQVNKIETLNDIKGFHHLEVYLNEIKQGL